MSEQQFTLYWMGGTREVVRGWNIADAMTRAGYGRGALRALDFYASGDCDRYEWSIADHKWRSKYHLPYQ